MPSIFSRIISGELPGHIVASDDTFVAFLDIHPLVMGHTLVVPRREIDYIFDLPADMLSGILHFSKEVARKIERVVPCERIAISVIGLEVPHAHVHLIPIRTVGDMNFSRPKLRPAERELADLALQIQSA